MKHSKKWCKIAAGTLSLTGAIATPIALTSCSNNENGPTDPVSTYKLGSLLRNNSNSYPIEINYANDINSIDIDTSLLSLHTSSPSYIYFTFFDDSGHSVIYTSSNFEAKVNLETSISDVNIVENSSSTTGTDAYLGGIYFFLSNVNLPISMNLTYKLTSTNNPNFFGEGINHQEANVTINIK